MRAPELGDTDALFACFSDSEVMRYWATAAWTTRQQSVDRIEEDRRNIADGSALRLVLEPKAGGPILGAVTLFAFVEGSRRAETGYILARAAWGQGLIQEAMMALLNYGFTQLGLRRVEADIDPRNARSARSLERMGFRREGHLRERWIVEGEVSDSALYGLLAKEWLTRPEPRKREA